MKGKTTKREKNKPFSKACPNKLPKPLKLTENHSQAHEKIQFLILLHRIQILDLKGGEKEGKGKGKGKGKGERGKGLLL